jgi:hypothetical protein
MIILQLLDCNSEFQSRGWPAHTSVHHEISVSLQRIHYLNRIVQCLIDLPPTYNAICVYSIRRHDKSVEEQTGGMV